MPEETGGSEETRSYESTPDASSMAFPIEAEDSEGTDEAGEEVDPGVDVIEGLSDEEDIYPDDFWDWMVEPMGFLNGAWDEEGFMNEWDQETAPFQGPMWIDNSIRHNFESHCGLAREFMLMTERGPRSMEVEDVTAFFYAQEMYLMGMIWTVWPWPGDPETEAWPESIDRLLVVSSILGYSMYMHDVAEILEANAWDIANTPAAHVETGLYGSMPGNGIYQKTASEIADSLRDHLTNDCDLDLAAQAESWADEEYHQCFRLALQIVAHASHRIIDPETRANELSAEQHMNYLGAIGLADNEHKFGSYDQALTAIKDIYLDLSSNFIHVEPVGATEGDVCGTTGNWPPAFTLFLEST
jgi:hypothetical protein